MNSLEAYALDYFRYHGIHYLPGSDWLLSYSRIVLPLCQTEPAVAHAAVALGSLQRSFMTHDDGGAEHFRQALTQYNRSISSVQAYINTICKKRGCSNAAEMILVVTLLLFSFDILQGQDAAAAMHLRSGLKILFEQVKERAPPCHLPKDERIVALRVQPKSRVDILTQTFVRLDADLALIGGEDPYLFPICNQPMPLTFSSLEEAMVYLDVLEREIFHIWSAWFEVTETALISSRDDFMSLNEDMRDILTIASMRNESLEADLHLNQRAYKAREDLKHFKNALASIPIVSDDDPARILVDIHFFFLWVVVCTWRDSDEMEVDRFQDQFAYVLGRAEQYFAQQHAKQLQDLPSSPPVTFKSRPAAAVGTGMGQVLTVIIELCRDSVIRRRGIDIIRMMNMRGVYDSDYLASFYEAIVELEEGWAREIDPSLQNVRNLRAHQIPSQARIVECDISTVDAKAHYYSESTGQLVFAKYKRGDCDELEVEQRTFFVSRTSPGSSSYSESLTLLDTP